LPVVISDKVNIWREIKEGGGGEVEPLDPDRFASRIIDMLADRDRLKSYGEHGIETVSNLFNWSTIGERLEQAYQAIVDGRSPEHA
jgi:glycosyltransferase involved in cell wall biosynthesis